MKCVGRSENWSDERVDRRNEGGSEKNEQIELFSWVDRSEKRKKKTHRALNAWIVVCRVQIRTEKWVDRSLDRSVRRVQIMVRRCVDRSVWLGVWIGASQALCASERAASSACERGVENVWSENLGWNEFPLVLPYFTIKLKIFLVWPNLPSQPNMLFSGKWFPNFIFSQNKRTLIFFFFLGQTGSWVFGSDRMILFYFIFLGKWQNDWDLRETGFKLRV